MLNATVNHPNNALTSSNQKSFGLIKTLINGVWYNDISDTPELQKIRQQEKQHWFRNWVTADGSSGFLAQAGRYHLYVSYACPWAHRTILYRQLKGLQNVISMSVVHPRWAGANGWEFGEPVAVGGSPGISKLANPKGDTPMSTVDHVANRRYLYEVYQAAKPDFTGKVTVPVLWDKKTSTIVNNESGEIIRMLNSAFDAWGDASVNFYPDNLRSEIETMNAFVLDKVCNGVYKAGFASTQEAYDKAVQELFQALDTLDVRLSQQPYLLGDRITESDLHLFCTLCRFDAVYYGALKCNLKRLIDYPALSAYTGRIYNLPSVAATVKMNHIKQHYYDDLKAGNPVIVPVGPAIDLGNKADVVWH
ncbi:glutathione S-transferase C-terminal domain-containing protein [Brasilonema sp. UFV-L1]|uniref:glutathione S-transferase family protein n=1 Tax=Brasilonema sp. UFV-L1 TaxID=2234130 RepID=UPI00145F3594|nr:glutathione S-transferase C-terminal domain-containing protein [Brasilonema sp. UFV-L1]NMG11922.1 glutathione S-transferase family protein [Brasilonema sp. UFV-L1]